MFHDLLRSGELQAAVSSVLEDRNRDRGRFADLLGDLRARSTSSDAHDVAGLLALYLLASGDLVGARLAYSLALPRNEAHRMIETARIVPSPAECFQFEPMTESGQREFALEPMLTNWSAAARVEVEQRRVPPRVARIDAGRVFGLSFLPVTAEGRTCLNWYTHNANNPNKIAMTEGGGTIHLMCRDAILGSFESANDHDAGVLIGNHENFGHWLFNHLSRLALASCSPSLRGVPLVVGENITPVQLECLERMGYGQSMLIRLRRGCLARFNTLWAPMMPLCCGDEGALYWAPRIVEFLRARLGVRDTRPSGRGGRFYLTRRDSRWRHVVNEEEIIPKLARWGFEVIDPGTLTIARQIETAAEAEVIIGPFGAGMNLLLFAPRDTTIVEFKHHQRIMDINPALCRQIGQRYVSVAAIPAGQSADPLNADLLVALKDIEQTLAAAGITA